MYAYVQAVYSLYVCTRLILAVITAKTICSERRTSYDYAYIALERFQNNLIFVL